MGLFKAIIYSMHHKFIKIITAILLSTAIFIIGMYSGGNSSQDIVSRSEYTRGSLVSVMLDYGDGTFRTFNDVKVGEQESIFDLLKTLTEENDIEFSFKDYGGDMGAFITSINDTNSELEGRTDYWWQYWVNNQYGAIGMSNYLIQPGDIVLLKFINSTL